MATIKLNKLSLFSSTNRTVKSKIENKLSEIKTNLNMFKRIYICSSEHRSGDLDTLFKHEIKSPISNTRELHTCTNSDLGNVEIVFKRCNTVLGEVLGYIV